jgi:hypothetical protein
LSALLMLLGGVLIIASLVCWVIILIDAFRNEIWKGIVFVICGLYALYYSIIEFDHEQKWPIVLGYLLGGAIGGFLLFMGGAFGAGGGLGPGLGIP